MKTLLSSVAALCLLTAAPAAIAQPHHDHKRHGDHRHGWDRHHGGVHHHRDWSHYRHIGHAYHRYHLGHFYWPRGYHYRRWVYGEILPGVFFTTRYWLHDWRIYGLYPPPPGTRWVRYGPDALLIDRYSGEIIRVVYGIFY